MNWASELLPVGQIGGVGTLILVAWLVITRRLIWHTDLTSAKGDSDKTLGKCEKERDEWKHIALSLLGVTEKLTVQAEVTNEVMSRLPTPDTGE
jgi:hypothetical protein